MRKLLALFAVLVAAGLALADLGPPIPPFSEEPPVLVLRVTYDGQPVPYPKDMRIDTSCYVNGVLDPLTPTTFICEYGNCRNQGWQGSCNGWPGSKDTVSFGFWLPSFQQYYRTDNTIELDATKTSHYAINLLPDGSATVVKTQTVSRIPVADINRNPNPVCSATNWMLMAVGIVILVAGILAYAFWMRNSRKENNEAKGSGNSRRLKLLGIALCVIGLLLLALWIAGAVRWLFPAGFC